MSALSRPAYTGRMQAAFHRVHLGPEVLEAAARAFEAALGRLNESDCVLDPYTARRLVAGSIMDRALGGERDVATLQESGVTAVRALVSRAPP